MSKAKILVVVDMQHDFVDGSLGSPEAQAIVPKVEEKKASDEYDITFVTADTHFCNPDHDYMDTLEGQKLPVYHCIEGTVGWLPVIKVNTQDNMLKKYTFGYCDWRSTVEAKLGDVYETIPDDEDIEFEICGLCTDICVVSNALILRANFPDSKITCDASCCAGTTPEAHKAALAVMKSCQIDVINEG